MKTGCIGVYGGSFDPPHLGHLLAASCALACAPIDGLLILPSAHHPLGKAPRASFDQRVAMCRATFSDLRRAEVDTLEAELGGEGYTLTLLEELRRRQPGRALRLIVGQDILNQVERWHAWEQVTRLAPPWVIGRRGASAEQDGTLQIPDVSSREIRRRLASGESVEGLVHRDVLAILARDNPYRASA
ncbi:MAG: nicotinate-nicotinamide nucleotide adenylyltransferase [Deltaproteobacteria bacterium]|nr:nicotinate-nicotinamide nucleotide adenylyltransferase [Deltaproteobacteria bacterium]